MSATTEHLQTPRSVSRNLKWTEALRKVRRTLNTWRERAQQRHQLARMSDHTLQDIAISRVDALREAGKPFWRE